MMGASGCSNVPLRFLILALAIVFISTQVSAEENRFDIEGYAGWSLEILDGQTLEPNDNTSSSAGDHIRLSIQVANNNTSAPDGEWSFSFGHTGQWFGGLTGTLNGSLSFQTVSVTFGPVYEGYLLCKLDITNTLESEILELRTGPNPVNFTAAGSAEVAIVGQPSHVGDELSASILVHNQGQEEGAVKLVLSRSDGIVISTGNSVMISPGSSREVTSSFLLTNAGNHDVDWAIESETGGVDVELNGTFAVEIMESQDISANIDEVDWTLDNGLTLSTSIELSQGSSRLVSLSVLLKSGNEFNEFQSYELNLNPGIRTIDIDLGHPDATRLQIVVSPIGWVSLEGDGIAIVELQAPQIIPSIEIGQISPNPSQFGSTVTIPFTLENSGSSRSSSGIVRIINVADEMILSEKSVPALSSDGVHENSITIQSWNYHQTADVQLIWLMDGLTISKQFSIVTEEEVEGGINLPFNLAAAIYGALVGLVLVMTSLVVYRAVSERTPTTGDSWVSRNRENRLNRRNKEDEKREVSCPDCNQRLNIPSSHEGAVRCPACTTQFVVTPEGSTHDSTVTREPQVTSEITSEEKSTDRIAKSMDDLLDCPECAQVLKVPLSRRPVRSRCPACRTEFIAELG